MSPKEIIFTANIEWKFNRSRLVEITDITPVVWNPNTKQDEEIEITKDEAKALLSIFWKTGTLADLTEGIADVNHYEDYMQDRCDDQRESEYRDSLHA